MGLGQPGVFFKLHIDAIAHTDSHIPVNVPGKYLSKIVKEQNREAVV